MSKQGRVPSLSSAIDHTFATVDSAKLFLVESHVTITYGNLRDRVARLHSLFARQGLTRGDRIIVVTGDGAAAVALLFAALRAGIAVVIGDRDMPDVELERLAEASEPKAVFLDAGIKKRVGSISALSAATVVAIGEERGAPPYSSSVRRDRFSFSDALRDLLPAPLPPPVTEDTVALIVFTSGTTSRPKGVQITHGNLAAQLTTIGDVFGFDGASRIFNVLPWHHVDGLVHGPLATFFAAATLYREAKFRVQALSSILERVRVDRGTHFVAVPSLLALVLRLASDCRDCFRGPNFRFVISGADVLDVALWRRFEDHFGARVVNVYGLTETVCDALFCGPADATRRIGTLGKPGGCEARVVDDAGADVPPGETGELFIRGANVMTGYFRAPAETAAVMADGWLRTGDYVRMADDGLFEFVARKKNIIVSRGVNVHPEEIATAIRTLPGVAEAIAVGIPDATWGEAIVACVVAERGSALGEDAIVAHCRRTLSLEKQPSRIVLLDELPRGPAGKVLLDRVRGLIVAHPLARSETSRPDVYAIAASCFGVEPSSLSPTSTPFNTDGWDSMSHINFILTLEDTFGIQFSAANILNLESLADADEIVHSLGLAHQSARK